MGATQDLANFVVTRRTDPSPTAGAVARAVGVVVRRLTSMPVPVAPPVFSMPADAPRPRFAARLIVSGLGSRGPPSVLAAS